MIAGNIWYYKYIQNSLPLLRATSYDLWFETFKLSKYHEVNTTNALFRRYSGVPAALPSYIAYSRVKPSTETVTVLRPFAGRTVKDL